MSDIIQSTDFLSGPYSIPQDECSNIQPWIDKYEKQYLIELLGCELYDLFIADLVDGVPQTQRFIDIYNEFCIDDDSCVRRSEGMKEMVKQLVYFYIMRDLPVRKTQTGVYFNNNEVSNGPTYSNFNLIEGFNDGVRNYHEIQWYIDDNLSTYPEENMQPLDYISGI